MQAIHAAVDACRQFQAVDSQHPHLVLCSVASQERLLLAADHLFKLNVRCTLFREPDRADEVTALATEPVCGQRRRGLERYHCLRREDFLAAPEQDGSCPERPCP